MVRLISILHLLLLPLLFACNVEHEPDIFPDYTNDQCYRNAFDNGHIYKLDGKIYLKGGGSFQEDFDFSNTTLRPCQLNLGLGREHYQALIEPEFDSVADHLDELSENDSVIILMSEQQHKVYPINIVRQHIIINDSVDGNPVMVTFDVLSDQANVYRRKYCDTLFTFGVSGYSYWDFDIMDAQSSFILWDRETESLWWTLIKKAVSGKMKDNWMVVYDQSKWKETTWAEIVNNYPDAAVLKSGQMMDPPETWPQYFEVYCK